MLRRKDGPEKELLNQPPVNSPEKKIKITKALKEHSAQVEKERFSRIDFVFLNFLFPCVFF
jgi:hypothetical protein